jgi:hypothetical protein
MQRRFPRFKAGESLTSEVTAGKLNAMARGLEERTPGEAKGTRLKTSSFGFAYSADPGGGRSVSLPFQISTRSGVEPGTTEVVVKPSTVTASWAPGSITPTIDGTPIDDDPAPTLTVNTGDTVSLKVTVIPVASGPFTGINDNGEEFDYYTTNRQNATYSGISIVVRPSVDDSAFAWVDALSGAITNGVYYLNLGTIQASGVSNQVYGPASVDTQPISPTIGPPYNLNVASGIALDWDLAQYNVPG